MKTIETVWLQDCSGSMNIQQAIQRVNQGFQELIQELIKRDQDASEHRYFLSLACFDDRAYWQFRNKAIAQVQWKDLKATGVTEMGKALHLSLSRLKEIQEQGGQAVVVLASDGMATDEYEATLQEISQLCQTASFSRRALALGEDADQAMLLNFVVSPAHLYRAEQPEQISVVMQEALKAALDALPSAEATSSSASAVSKPGPKPPAPSVNTSPKTDTEEPFVADYRQLEGADFIKKYQKSEHFFKIGLANRGDYIKGKSPLFATQPTGFVLVALRQPGQTQHLLAVPNPQMRYQEKLYTSTGLPEFFVAHEAFPSGAFVLEVLKPALITEQAGKWLCSEKGLLKFKKV